MRTGVNAAGVSAVALARTCLAGEAEKWKGGCVHPIGLTAVMEEENELVCTVCGCASLISVTHFVTRFVPPLFVVACCLDCLWLCAWRFAHRAFC